tara:strand:+ start:376 stop:708 length:333 start_codon:yes stop_codon:yes gene_type:complete
MVPSRPGLISEYIDCLCGQSSHAIRFTLESFDDEDDDLSFILHMQVNDYLPFFRRFWIGFKYIFKIRTESNDYWDTTLLGKEAAEKIKKMCEKYLLEHEKWANKLTEKSL